MMEAYIGSCTCVDLSDTHDNNIIVKYTVTYACQLAGSIESTWPCYYVINIGGAYIECCTYTMITIHLF